MPCILNAANEIAVEAFLSEKVTFLKMPEIIEGTMSKVNYISNPALEDYYQSDKEARNVANQLIES